MASLLGRRLEEDARKTIWTSLRVKLLVPHTGGMPKNEGDTHAHPDDCEDLLTPTWGSLRTLTSEAQEMQHVDWSPFLDLMLQYRTVLKINEW